MHIVLDDEVAVFPAYAGMIPITMQMQEIVGSVPRIRGDDPECFNIAKRLGLCSPHTRG